jgi:sugar O-acyltransferase (sialic acid O-acetyltransferase NeuD family)
MDSIVLVGSSGHARVIIDIIEREGKYRIAGLLDRFRKVGEHTLGYAVLGQEEDLPRLVLEHGLQGTMVAIGDNSIRATETARVMECCPGMKLVTAVHPGARIGKGVSIGEGTAIMAGVVVNPCCTVGRSCILNTNSSLDHDSWMDDFSSLGPRAVTGGNCHVGRYSAIGIGAILLQQIEVGEHTVVGAGATVLRNLGSFQVAFGTPAKSVRSRQAGDKYL